MKEVRLFVELTRADNGTITIITGGGNYNDGCMESHTSVESAIKDLSDRVFLEYNSMVDTGN